MKTYLVKSITNYALMVQIVNAENKIDAICLASESTAPEGGAWPGAEAIEIDTNSYGVVLSAY